MPEEWGCRPFVMASCDGSEETDVGGKQRRETRALRLESGCRRWLAEG